MPVHELYLHGALKAAVPASGADAETASSCLSLSALPSPRPRCRVGFLFSAAWPATMTPLPLPFSPHLTLGHNFCASCSVLLVVCFPGRLCRSRLQLCGDDDDAAAAQGALSAPNHPAARQPRVASDHESTAFTTSASVNTRANLEVLHGALRLVSPGGARGRRGALCARRAVSGRADD